MTKKLICLLLAAFLVVSIVALFVACCNKPASPDETTITDSNIAPSESSTDNTAAQQTATILSPQAPSEAVTT